MPAAFARVASLGTESERSIARQASATIAVRRSASDVSFGRQRLHGRKPARSASAGLGWKRTFSRRGRRAPQDGRQYTPVVSTEYQNRPSAPASRRSTARQRASSVGKEENRSDSGHFARAFMMRLQWVRY